MQINKNVEIEWYYMQEKRVIVLIVVKATHFFQTCRENTLQINQCVPTTQN